MLMKYTEEIFNILSKGGFISSNSVSPAVKRYYDAIEEELAEYYEYYKGIGFYLEGGDGYYLFTRREAKVDLERKLEAAMKILLLERRNDICGDNQNVRIHSGGHLRIKGDLTDHAGGRKHA